MVDVGDDVGDAGNLPFDRARAMLGIGADRHAALAFRVPRDAVAHFPRQVEPLAVVLEHVDDAETLLVVVEAAGDEIVEDALAGVAERRVPEIVPERDGLGQLLVEPQHLGDAARNLRDLERVRQAGAVVIPVGAKNTCVLCFSRRNALQWITRSRSRWNAGRMGSSGFGPRRGPCCRRFWPHWGARISRSRCSNCCRRLMDSDSSSLLSLSR